MQTSTPRNINYFLIGIVVVTAITLVVFAAITAGSGVLLELIGGVIVLGVISIGLATVGVSLFTKWAKAQNDRDKEKHHHAEQMAEKGIVVTGNGFPDYTWIQSQIAAPEQKQLPRHEWNQDVEKWRMAGVELVALTIDMEGRESKKIISREKAQENDLFKSAGRVQNAFDFLGKNHLTYVQMAGGKQEGTYIQDSMNAGELMAILSPSRLRGR
jgi:hypothetical protein